MGSYTPGHIVHTPSSIPKLNGTWSGSKEHCFRRAGFVSAVFSVPSSLLLLLHFSQNHLLIFNSPTMTYIYIWSFELALYCNWWSVYYCAQSLPFLTLSQQSRSPTRLLLLQQHHNTALITQFNWGLLKFPQAVARRVLVSSLGDAVDLPAGALLSPASPCGGWVYFFTNLAISVDEFLILYLFLILTNLFSQLFRSGKNVQRIFTIYL